MYKTYFACVAATIILGVTVTSTSFSADEFPLRKKYSELLTISTQELNTGYNKVVIVDVRAKFEYDVVHIKDAHHIPVSNMQFLSNLEKLRTKNDSKKVVFYCNGHTCPKSYEAGQQAKDAGFQNVYVYDSGVFEWVKNYPEKGVFFGETPVDKSKMIEKSQLKARSLPYSEFISKSGVFIDVRDPIQRKKIPNIKGLKSIPLDKLLPLLEAKNFIDQPLYFFDEVGKQIEWLDYYLIRQGYKNYRFLDGGVASIKE